MVRCLQGKDHEHTGGSDDRIDGGVLGESFHALVLVHVEDKALLDQELHLKPTPT